jgi:hypothetical protein
VLPTLLESELYVALMYHVNLENHLLRSAVSSRSFSLQRMIRFAEIRISCTD